MPDPRLRVRPLPLLALALAAGILLVPAAEAHVTETSGPYRIELGWGVEPPLSGLDNYVSVAVTDAGGDAVAVRSGTLSVEVSHGDDAVTLPLQAADEEPGALRATLIPTRPGSYAFHVSGAVAGRTVDVRARCSQRTFECVEDRATAEFPRGEPAAAELAVRLDRESARAALAADDADGARRKATLALALAAAALALALVVLLRSRRKRGAP